MAKDAKDALEHYVQIDPVKLKEGKPITFDLYLHLPLNDRIVHVKEKGVTLDSKALATLTQRTLKQIYIHKDELGLFDSYLNAVDVPIVSVEKQAPVLMQNLLKTDANSQKEAQKQSKEFVKNVIEQSTHESKNDFLDTLNHSKCEHAAAVATYSILFCIALEKNSPKELQNISFAGMLHDLGLTQLMPNLIGIPQSKRSADEQKSYEQHVALGLELMKDMELNLDTEVSKLIGHHHEKFDGTGFPNKMKGFYLSEQEQVIILADIIDSIQRGWFDGVNRSLEDSIKFIKNIEVNPAFPHYVHPDIFQRIIKWIEKSGSEQQMLEAQKIVEDTKEKISKKSKQ